MKKLFLLMLATSFTIFTLAQQSYEFKVKTKEYSAPDNLEQSIDRPAPVNSNPLAVPDIKSGTAAKAVTIRELGNAGNAWGLSSGNRTYMWADNDLQSVVFSHRMLNPPGTGYLAYDVSTDQGSTFEVDQQIYDPSLYPAGATLGNARYPQCVIYNPTGNTDPANAFLSFFGAILDETNGDGWGGYGFGTNPLTAVNPTTPTQNGFSSPGDELVYSVPDAFHIRSNGQTIIMEPSLVDGQFDDYTGYLIYSTGTYNAGTQLFDYEQELIEFDITGGSEGTRCISAKIAFDSDGQVGYMAMLSNNGENEVADGCYYPVLFQTTNGGEDWDGPFTVSLGGPDGLGAVLNYLPDEFIEANFDPVPERDEILYTSAFDIDVAVDNHGNPHLLFAVGVRGTDAFSIATSWEDLFGTGNSIALVHAASYDGMDTWFADTLNTPITFRGTFPGNNDLDEDLRPYISTTPDGSKLFFSWQCTDIENVEDNLAPDIYCVGYDVDALSYTELYNVSAFTDIMWQSWMATASYYVFDDGAGNYEIPFVCQEMDPDDNGASVAFKYVDDFIITDADFGVWVSTAEPQKGLLSISGNYPNPCRDKTNINMTLTEAANIQFNISNLIGQKIQSINYGPFNKGTHKISVDVSGLESGIYIYTLTTGSDAVAGKMIVE